MTDEAYLWVGFSLVVLVMLVLDLGVFHRAARSVRLREAAAWTTVWVGVAMLFCLVIYVYDHFYKGREVTRALDFLTGYIIEWSLSMDNVFVFAVIFGYFAVPAHYQHRVLFWGILGAVIMRLVFILAGAWLLAKFHWLIYPMGAFLIFTGIKLMWDREKKSDLSHNRVLRMARWCLPVTRDYVAQRFFVRMTREQARGMTQSPAADSPDSAAEPSPRKGRLRLYATPLFLVLLVVETTDVAFAVDSIPAIFGVTTDPFIVFSSNVFAILGLRSLYFLLAGTMDLFRYLSVGLATILCFVGVKMLLPGMQEALVWWGTLAEPPEGTEWGIPTPISLAVVCGILLVAVAASLLHARLSKPAPSEIPIEEGH
jgi:tellurite resistance protein TerC